MPRRWRQTQMQRGGSVPWMLRTPIPAPAFAEPVEPGRWGRPVLLPGGAGPGGGPASPRPRARRRAVFLLGCGPSPLIRPLMPGASVPQA